MKATRLIISAAAAIIAANAFGQSFTVQMKNGDKIAYNTDDVESIIFNEESTQQTQPPRIGDFYYSDGSWSTALKEGATPIGVVFCIGEAYNDKASYYTQKDGKTKFDEFHGYVVALRDATYDTASGTNTGVWWSSFDANFTGSGASTNTADFLGYTNTKAIVSTAIREKGALTADNNNFPAAYYATTAYEEACPSPASSSGWFLPSAYQLKYIYDRVYFDEDGSGRSCIENSFKALGEDIAIPMYAPDSEYWTSTEKIDAYGTSTWAYYFCFDERSIKPGFITDYRKNTGMRVRSVLAF